MELIGKVHMGKVFSKDLARQSGVKYFPTIMYFPAGDKSDPNRFENYEGDITANDIVTWALQVVFCQEDSFLHQLSQTLPEQKMNFCKLFQNQGLKLENPAWACQNVLSFFFSF
jgi:hypothetical protein